MLIRLQGLLMAHAKLHCKLPRWHTKSRALYWHKPFT